MIEHTHEVPPAGLRKTGVTCRSCGQNEMCFPHRLDPLTLERFQQCIRQRRQLARGEVLYVPGRPARSLYVVRGGSLKSYATAPDGGEFVYGFHLPGDVLGLESPAGGKHDHFAMALEPSQYCEISAETLIDLLPRAATLHRQVMRAVGRQLTEQRRQLCVHGRRDARVQLATFLVEFSRRRAKCRLSPTCFRLSMDRRDIANYLGLTVETVSRAFSRLQREGLLESRGKHVNVLRPRSLAALCAIDRSATGRRSMR